MSPTPLRDFKHDGKTLARFFFVTDPDGYKIEVIQKRRPIWLNAFNTKTFKGGQP